MCRQSTEEDTSPIRDAREALLACIEQLTVYVPNDLLASLTLVMLDTIGFDDANATRLVRQLKTEERVKHMILMLPREAASIGSLQGHFRVSPFIQRFVLAHTTPHSNCAGGRAPKLSAIIFKCVFEARGFADSDNTACSCQS